MRCLFVNYSHPETPHVSGRRLHCFSKELARQGHRIVLLTKSLRDDERPELPQHVAKRIEAHEWSEPYLLPCVPARVPLLSRQRRGTLPALGSKCVVVWHYLTRSGVFGDWVEGTRPYWNLLAQEFKPQLVWATFGNTDAWFIGQNVARRALAPWVMDVKDGWDPFVPGPLRAILARRFQGGAWLTSNSEFTAKAARPWFRQEHTTIYSGIDARQFNGVDPVAHGAAPLPSDAQFRIVLSGAVYREAVLSDFLAAIRQWLESLEGAQRSQVVVAYVGSAKEMFERHAGALKQHCRVEAYGYLPFADFVGLVRAASVNAYLWLPTTFHHKLLELIACERPVVAFPGEHAESKELARQLSAPLNCCETVASLTGCLKKLWNGAPGSRAGVNLAALDTFTWESQARRLLQVFEQVVRGPN